MDFRKNFNSEYSTYLFERFQTFRKAMQVDALIKLRVKFREAC
jgi:hypothetical protein